QAKSSKRERPFAARCAAALKLFLAQMKPPVRENSLKATLAFAAVGLVATTTSGTGGAFVSSPSCYTSRSSSGSRAAATRSSCCLPSGSRSTGAGITNGIRSRHGSSSSGGSSSRTVGHSSSRTPTTLMGLRRGPGGGRRDDSSSSGGETENALRRTPGTGDGDEEAQSGRNE
ncbi:unnamed protein product, partial [Ectocarpus sp. 12 AP-2014]